MAAPRKILHVVAAYPDIRQRLFDDFFSPRHRAYALHHGLEYLVGKGDGFRRNPNWCRLNTIRQMIRRRELNDGDAVLLMDADMCIVDGTKSFLTAKSFTYAVDNMNTHCLGWYALNVNPWTRALIELLLDEDLYWRHREEPNWETWCEQAAWYIIAGISSSPPVDCYRTPPYGWGQNPDAPLSVPELLEHVEVRGPEWNTSALPEELDNSGALALKRYYSNSSRKQDTILRHFCGGQSWRLDYALRPLFPSPLNAALSICPRHEPPPPPPFPTPSSTPAAGLLAPDSPLKVDGKLPTGGLAISFNKTPRG